MIIFKIKLRKTEYDASEKKNVRKTFKYNAYKDKTEEVEYNSAGNLKKKNCFYL